MKYIIDIPNADVSRWIGETPFGKKLYVPISVENGKEYNIGTEIYVEEYTESDRQAIENEVWEFAKIFMDDMGVDDLEVVNGDTIKRYFAMTYQEAKARYEAWKKKKDEVRVGDEVILYDNVKMIVTQVDHGTSIQGVDENGECYECIERNVVKKTGRHFPEIIELLKKMREE